jgi:hypothetical protein
LVLVSWDSLAILCKLIAFNCLNQDIIPVGQHPSYIQPIMRDVWPGHLCKRFSLYLFETQGSLLSLDIIT